MNTDSFLGRGVPALRQPNALPAVCEISESFLDGDPQITFFWTNIDQHQTPEINKEKESLKVIFEQEHTDPDNEVFAIYLTLAKFIPETGKKFDFFEYTVDGIMNVAIKKTSMGPLKIQLSDPNLQADILSSKTDCQSLQ